MTQVVLVDKNDKQIGVEEKIAAHKKALLHRAFSGFVFNDKKELLIQQRSSIKYHNPEIWSNTVCSHPHPGETTKQGIERRIFEELGFECELTKIKEFIYKKAFDNGLTEHEYDHIFVGIYNGNVFPNKDEVMNYKRISLEDLEKDMQKNPDNYSYWLKKILKLGFLPDR